jgi:hypothetical protein
MPTISVAANRPTNIVPNIGDIVTGKVSHIHHDERGGGELFHICHTLVDAFVRLLVQQRNEMLIGFEGFYAYFVFIIVIIIIHCVCIHWN